MKALKAVFAVLAAAAVPVALTMGASVTLSSAASAEVRFGRNVRIGGHDFSHQSFNRKRRAKIYLYDRAPSRSGCVWRSDGHGGKVKTCHLRRIR